MAQAKRPQNLMRSCLAACTPARCWLLALWALLMLALPPILEAFALLPPETGFIPRLLLIFLLPAVFLRRPSFRIGLGIVLVSALFSLFTPLSWRTVIDGLNNRMQDAFFHLRGPRKPSGQVVIVDIDQNSLNTVGQWPWPRTYLAEVLEILKADGARCIGFDIVFAEPDRHSLGDWLRRFKGLGLEVGVDEKTEISPAQIRGIVLDEWERRLHEADPRFALDPALPSAEREAAIISEYLRETQGAWEEAQRTLTERYTRAGLSYQNSLFQAPNRPFLEMVQASRDLYFLERRQLLESSASTSPNLILDNDAALGAAMHDGRVVAGGLFITAQNAGSRLEAFHKSESRRESRGLVVSAGIIGVEEVFPGLRKAIEQVPNVASIQDQIYHQGTFNIVPDRSGAARYYTIMMQAPVFLESLVLKPDLEDIEGLALLDPDNYETKIVSQYFTYPSLALEMLRAANGYESIEPGYKSEERGIFLRREKGFLYEDAEPLLYTNEAFPEILPEELFIPVDFKGDISIDFLGFGGSWHPESDYGPEYYFKYISLSDLLQNRFPEGTFKNKYVLIGSTDPTLSDLVGSPFRAAFPGVEVHATMLENFVQQRFLLDQGKWATLYQFLGILVVGSCIAAAVAYAESWLAGLTILLVLLGLPALSYWGMAHGAVIINFVYPWLCTTLMTGTIIIINFFVEGRDRRFVTTQFGKMVSNDVLKKLRDDPNGVSLKGQRSSISVMFSDIAGFTSIAEKMPPHKLVELLNDYFTPMTDIILKHDGFIDKFIGDAIMSCWGVPFPDARHSLNACVATLEQQRTLDILAPKIAEKYGIKITVRMGLASGEASAAMMGSDSRKSYTVMGDVVNLGARLEPCCKDYKVSIIIDENTRLDCGDAIVTRCIDKVVVTGKSVPIPIYELVALKGELSVEQDEFLREFERALQLHWEQRWDESEAILLRYPEDGPSQLLLSRIAQYRMHPPSADWRGEYVRLSKS